MFFRLLFSGGTFHPDHPSAFRLKDLKNFSTFHNKILTMLDNEGVSFFRFPRILTCFTYSVFKRPISEIASTSKSVNM